MFRLQIGRSVFSRNFPLTLPRAFDDPSRLPADQPGLVQRSLKAVWEICREERRSGDNGRMALIGRIPPGRFPLADLVRSVRSPSLVRDSGVDASGTPDLLTAQSLTGVGLLGVAILPALMIASVLTEAAVAVPAVMAMGFIAVAQAVLARKPAVAHGWTAVVLGGLFLWIFAATGPGTAEHGAGSAVLALAPLFAAAPALVQMLLVRGSTEWSGSGKAHDVALSPLTGSECEEAGAVPLAVRREQPDAESRAVLWLPTLLAAAQSCAAPTSRAFLPDATANESSDVDYAVDFAFRLLGPDAAERSVELVRGTTAPGLVQVGKRQCRQILLAIVGDALRQAPAGARIQVDTKTLRGAVLLRLTVTGAGVAAAPSAAAAEDGAMARGLIDAANGTILRESGPEEGWTVSVRLPMSADHLSPGGTTS